MRRTNLTSKDAQTVLDYCYKHHIMIDAKLHRELLRGCEMKVYLKNRSDMTTEEKKKIDAWLIEQEDD